MERHISVLILIVLLAFSGYSQISRQEYISRYQLLAIDEMNRTGIPASIKMAQACLESADGNSELSRKSNNHFGIKCKKNWKGKKVYYDDDAKNECFRKYSTVEESYIDHSNFLMDNPRYASLFELDPTDYKGWARGLKKAGYATAPHYARKLIEIIEDNKLYRLDMKMNYNELAVFEQEKIGNKGMSNSLTINPYTPHKVIKTNRVKSVVAREGDTYEMIAQELGLNDWELYRYNDRPPGYRPVANEIVYIRPKKNKTKKDRTTHRVEQGDSMHYISQLYGIKLKNLCKRNGIKAAQKLTPGQVIYLRKKG